MAPKYLYKLAVVRWQCFAAPERHTRGGSMDTQKAVGYLRDHAHRYGIGATLHELQHRLINKVAHFEVIKGMTVRTRDVKDPGLFEAPGFEGRFVDEERLRECAQDSANQMTPEFLRTAMARGDRCYALFDGGTLASYGWYSDLPCALDEHFVLHFDPAWTYMYKGYTMPAYRGKRLHAVGMCRALRALTEEGQEGLISCVASNNFASLQSVTRMGYKIFGDVYMLRAGGRCFTYATPSCREYGFRVESPAAQTMWIRRSA
jgi:hypothetical protein